MKLEDLLKTLDEDQIEKLQDCLISIRYDVDTAESYDELTKWIMEMSDAIE